MDPLTAKYPELTPYQFASNTPIWAIDIDGLEAGFTQGGISKPANDQQNTIPTSYNGNPDNTPPALQTAKKQNEGAINQAWTQHDKIVNRDPGLIRPLNPKDKMDPFLVAPNGLFASLKPAMQIASVVYGGYGLTNLSFKGLLLTSSKTERLVNTGIDIIGQAAINGGFSNVDYGDASYKLFLQPVVANGLASVIDFKPFSADNKFSATGFGKSFSLTAVDLSFKYGSTFSSNALLKNVTGEYLKKGTESFIYGTMFKIPVDWTFKAATRVTKDKIK